MARAVPLFPALLGPAFERLDAPVRRLHQGTSGVYQGNASVERGAGWLVALACALARLPRSMQDAPLRVELQADAHGETWTRWFGDSPPMRSHLRIKDGFLEERLGPAVVRFAVQESGGAMLWQAVRMKVMGAPLPRPTFDLRARVQGVDGVYHFEIQARVLGIGTLIRYQGVLRVKQ
jgi:hypothetical protein